MTVSPEIKQQMVTTYIAGTSLKSIAHDFGVSERTVSKAVKDAGYPVRPPATMVKMSKETEDKIFKMYNSGKSRLAIARHVKMSPATVTRALQRRGIAPNGRTEDKSNWPTKEELIADNKRFAEEAMKEPLGYGASSICGVF